jgi:Putative beta-barrel porin-2, OmpL-like. bbp2
VNYTYSFNHPIDDTVVGSTALARNNELEISFIGVGGDLHAGNVRARLLLQYGTRSTVVPRNDGSLLRGQFDLATAYRYISEGYVGYHINWLHGVNVDAGIFMSYVGLFSYDNFENWAYQPSYTSDNTPWFFNGARIQIFPTDRLKVEIWIINGWQSYAKFNDLPGAGYQIRYAPYEWMNMVFNGYVGTDTQDHPGRVRFHSDNSFLLRYYHHPRAKGLSQGAFSLTFDLGFEQGDGVQAFSGSGTEGNCTNATPCEQDFVSGMAYNRLWFYRNIFGWTAGGGFIHNPGRYLVLVPTGVATSTGLLGGFDTSPGTKFDAWDISTTFDWMPTEQITFRFEFVHRQASVPHFAGRGGVTSPDGYKSGGLASPDGTIFTSVPSGWTPDLVQQESRIIAALLFRI